MAITERYTHERCESGNFLAQRNVLTVKVLLCLLCRRIGSRDRIGCQRSDARSLTFMCRMHSASQKTLLFIVSLAALLPFVLAACGSTGGPGPGTGSTPTPTPTTVQGYGTAHGCPSDAVVTPAPPAANVTVKLTDANATIMAHVGDVIEIQLPFGLRWTGPTTSGGGLQSQTPAGYASTDSGMCIWRFSASSAGTTHLTFSARAICLKDQYCPQFILALLFTIVVK